MKEHLVYVPYKDFVEGNQAIAILNKIKGMSELYRDMIPNCILSTLGILNEDETNAGND